MADSINQRINATLLDRTSKKELHAALVALQAAVVSMAEKLDADGGVTDTDYASTVEETIKE